MRTHSGAHRAPGGVRLIASRSEPSRDPLSPAAPKGEISTRRVVNDARITSMRPLTHDTFEIIVRCAPDSPTIFARAGQFLTLKFPGVDKPRPYSLARAPEAERPGEHTFFIRLVPGGEVSSWLAAGDRTDERLEISGPLGAFGLDDSSAPMVCIAGGSGMSAIQAVIEHACNRQAERDCIFFYGAREQRDLYCTEDIEAIRSRWHAAYRFQFVPVLSEEMAGTDWNGVRGLVTDHVKRAYLENGRIDPVHCKAYFCGPPPMIEAGTAVLKEFGVSEDDIFCDIFEDASSPAPVIDNVKCVLCDECLLVKPVADCIVETSGFEVGPDGQVSGFDVFEPARSSSLYYNALVIDEKACIRCYACVSACPHDAIAPGNPPIAQTLRQRSRPV